MARTLRTLCILGSMTSLTSLATMITLAAAGCGDDAIVESHEHDAGDHDAQVDETHSHETCGLIEHCTDTVDLTDGLEAKSKNGSFLVRVVSHAELGVSDNEITVEVEDDAGALVKGAKVTQDVFSVDCMHGGPLPAKELTTNADGQCELAPVHEHQGPWDTTLAIDAAGVKDSVVFHFCVPLPGDAG